MIVQIVGVLGSTNSAELWVSGAVSSLIGVSLLIRFLTPVGAGLATMNHEASSTLSSGATAAAEQ
jgi:hypothetical protein